MSEDCEVGGHYKKFINKWDLIIAQRQLFIHCVANQNMIYITMYVSPTLEPGLTPFKVSILPSTNCGGY